MFSVLIPVYNHRDYLLKAVLSAISSPLVREVLVCDDGSTDGSDKLVAMLGAGGAKPVRDVTPQPRINRGAHACLNALCRQATQPWLAVLNSDDALVPGRFELLARCLRREPYDFAFGQLLVCDAAGTFIGRKNGPFDPEYPLPPGLDVARLAAQSRWTALLANQNFVATTGNMVFRKSLWQRIGGFAPYRYVHDWHFALYASLTGVVRYVPFPLTAYRVHASNTIKESGCRVDAEVTDMFERLIAERPDLAADPDFRTALRANRHLPPSDGAAMLDRSPPTGSKPHAIAASLDSTIGSVT